MERDSASLAQSKQVGTGVKQGGKGLEGCGTGGGGVESTMMNTSLMLWWFM